MECEMWCSALVLMIPQIKVTTPRIVALLFEIVLTIQLTCFFSKGS